MKKLIVILVGVLSLAHSGSVFARETVPFMEHAAEFTRVKAETGKIRQMTGVVEQIDRAAGKIDLKNRLYQRSFKIVDETQYKNGREKLNLHDLQPGTRVVIRYRDLGAVKEARIIQLEQAE